MTSRGTGFWTRKRGVNVPVASEQASAEDTPTENQPQFVYARSREEAQQILDRSYLTRYEAVLQSEWAALRGRVEQAEKALEEVEPLIDAQFEGHIGIAEFMEKSRKLNLALDIVRSAIAARAAVSTAPPVTTEVQKDSL